LLVFLAIWFILGGLDALFRLKTNHLKNRIAKIEDDWKLTEPLMNEREALMQQKQELSDFLVFIGEHLQKGMLYSKKLSELSRIIPREIWLRELSLKTETKDVQKTFFLEVKASIGYLKNDEDMLRKINEFVERLKNDKPFFKDFDSLSLSAIQKQAQVQRIMDFQLTLPLKQGE